MCAKKLAVIKLALILVTVSRMPFAQAGARDIGIYTDELGTQSTGTYRAPYVPLNLYVIGFDLDGQVKSFEFGLNLPGAMTMVGPIVDPVSFDASPYFVGPDPTNLGAATAPIIETGGCVDGMGVLVLAHYVGIFFTPLPGDASICLVGVTPSSFNGAPGYVQCDGTLVPFGFAQNGGASHPNGCLVMNPSPPCCCPGQEHAFTTDDVLATPGASMGVPVALTVSWEDNCAASLRSAKCSCTLLYHSGLAFDLDYDSTLLTWLGIEPQFEAGIPYSVTELGSHSVHVELGSGAAPEFGGLVDMPPGEVLAQLGVRMAVGGGTAAVHFTNIRAARGDGGYTQFPDRTVLVSNDPAVRTTSLSMGLLKAAFR